MTALAEADEAEAATNGTPVAPEATGEATTAQAGLADAATSEPATGDASTPTAAETPSAAPTAAPAASGAAPAAAAPAASLPFFGIVRVTAPDGLRVRRTPDAASRNNTIGGLAHGEEIEAHARVGEWVAVTYRMTTAYVHGGYVELLPAASSVGAERGPAVRADRTPPAHPATPSPTATSASPRAPRIESSSGSTRTTSRTPPTSAPAPALASPDRPAAGGGEFATLTGNAIAKTTAKEAAVLNALRADPRRFNPAWLVTAQRALGVVDATGAMNTETLRAMRTRSGKPSLDAGAILDNSFLLGIVPGEPFMATEHGFAEHDADPGATAPPDRAAQAVGYASYREYRKSFVTITFLGRSMIGQGSGEGHPYLAARVKAAEAFLRQRHPGLNDEGVIKKIGWNGLGNISYADKVGTTLSHQHTMGLAIDIDPAHNPYIFNETGTGLPHDQAMWWIETFEQMFKIATRIYGGQPIKPDTLMEWSKTISTEELFQRVAATSNAFAKYLELSKKPKEEILSALTGAGYSADEANAELPNVQKAEELFHKADGRKRATALTNIEEELLIALRDVAGLSWGGTEMSMRENGDFMHFDCRDTDFGRAVYSKKAPRQTHVR